MSKLSENTLHYICVTLSIF